MGAPHSTGGSFTAYRSTDGRSWTTIATTTISMPATIYVGLAVASRDAAQLAASDLHEPPDRAALPAPWRNRDVGSPVRAGTAASSAPGTFSVTGAGEAIWGSADQFQYVYQPIQGDTEIIARVASLQATHAGAKAGVMIRESLNTGARHASMFATGSSGWSFQYRDVTDGWSFVSAGSGGTAPGWVRLMRAGDRLTGYQSTDGKSWSLVGSETIEMSASVYVGLAVSSRVETVTTAATFSERCRIERLVSVERASDSVDHQPGGKCDIHRAGKHDRRRRRQRFGWHDRACRHLSRVDASQV